jgi:hypothetical protein
MKTKWPSGVPVCRHISWGIVTLTGTDVEWINAIGRQVALVSVRAEELYAKGWSVAPYVNWAWLEHLTPLNADARAMLAIARGK